MHRYTQQVCIMFEVNNEDTRTKLMLSLLLTRNIFHTLFISSVSILN